MVHSGRVNCLSALAVISLCCSPSICELYLDQNFQYQMNATESSSLSSSQASNSSDGNKLTFPNTSRKNNNGMQGNNNIPRTGQVEKLVNEFQQYYTGNKETHNGIPDPASIPAHNRRQNRENVSHHHFISMLLFILYFHISLLER